MCKIFLKTGILLTVILTSCNNVPDENGNNKVDSTKAITIQKDSQKLIDRDSVMKIAEANAKTAYRDLSIYTVKAELKDEKWYVDYEIIDPQMVGGGPHYIISAVTGKIDSCRYEQ